MTVEKPWVRVRDWLRREGGDSFRESCCRGSPVGQSMHACMHVCMHASVVFCIGAVHRGRAKKVVVLCEAPLCWHVLKTLHSGTVLIFVLRAAFRMTSSVKKNIWLVWCTLCTPHTVFLPFLSTKSRTIYPIQNRWRRLALRKRWKELLCNLMYVWRFFWCCM